MKYIFIFYIKNINQLIIIEINFNFMYVYYFCYRFGLKIVEQNVSNNLHNEDCNYQNRIQRVTIHQIKV